MKFKSEKYSENLFTSLTSEISLTELQLEALLEMEILFAAGDLLEIELIQIVELSSRPSVSTPFSIHIRYSKTSHKVLY